MNLLEDTVRPYTSKCNRIPPALLFIVLAISYQTIFTMHRVLAEVVHGQEFMLELFDEDDRKDDEFLGRTTVQTGTKIDR